MRLGFCSDTHLNFLTKPQRKLFAKSLCDKSLDAILITGDISESPDLDLHLEGLQEDTKLPIYYVLGNHDFYRSSVSAVRAKVTALYDSNKNLIWLPLAGVVSLTDRVGLIGHDGWYDGGYGDYWKSPVRMADFNMITDFVGLDAAGRFRRFQELATEAADYLGKVLEEAFQKLEHVYLATHVPPFKEAAWHLGQISNDNWLPFFSSKIMGDRLREIMQQYPNKKLDVLTGHSHSEGRAEILSNLVVYTAKAEYYNPALYRVIEI